MDFSELYRVDRRKKKSKIAILIRQYFIPSTLVVLFALIAQWTVRSLLFYPVRVNTDSMGNFVKKSESVFLIYPHLTSLKKNDIVYLEQDGLQFLCEIVAQEGEIVQIINKSLFINHVSKKDFSNISRDSTVFPGWITPRDNTQEFLTGPGKFVCINENWENTQDSRTWGPFSFDEVKGKVLFKKKS